MSHNVNWKDCEKCQRWTKNPKDYKFACYAGYCPAKIVDDKKKSK